ncbi:MAG: sulfurtransferase TusA family protein [Nitrospinota bacterium]
MSGVLACGLTTKGGGGNTVRNVTSCVDAWVCPREVFDVSGLANQLTAQMIQDDRSVKLPRKFKIAVSGCSDDCSLATVNDVGFIATTRKESGEEKKGFAVYVAGGMGNQSKTSHLLHEFVPLEEIGLVAEAVKRVFDKNGNRRNKNKARLRFLYEKLGKEKFESLYNGELEKLKAGESLKPIKFSPSKESVSVSDEVVPANDVDRELYRAWVRDNVTLQKQEGFYTVTIRVPLGEIPEKQLTELAGSLKKLSLSGVTVTHDQNFLVRWVPKNCLTSLFSEITSLQLGSQSSLTDVLCCAGAATCRLGICLSRGVSTAIADEFQKKSAAFSEIDDVKIHVSGCPNSCGQHAIGKIGLVGAARRLENRMAPFYAISLGGQVGEGVTAFGENIGTPHAKYIPRILSDFLLDYAKEKKRFSGFYEYIEKKGSKTLQSILARFSEIPAYNDDQSFYKDWGASEDFSLAGRGPGECGAGVFDMIDVDLEEAEGALEKGFSLLSGKQEGGLAAPLFYEAINRASRALLVTRGVEAKDDFDAFDLFGKEMILPGHADKKYERLLFLAAEFKKGYLRGESLIENSGLIKEFVVDVKALYNSMDESLHFRTRENGGDEGAVSDRPEKGGSGVELYDLRGVACPFNYVKTKLKLEEMEVDEQLRIYLDDGAPIKNVPNSLRNDGQEIVKMQKTDEGFFDLLIKKKV